MLNLSTTNYGDKRIFFDRPFIRVICFRGSRFSPKNGNLERSPNFSLNSITHIAPLLFFKRRGNIWGLNVLLPIFNRIRNVLEKSENIEIENVHKYHPNQANKKSVYSANPLYYIQAKKSLFVYPRHSLYSDSY
jgi:hypothetical protein